MGHLRTSFVTAGLACCALATTGDAQGIERGWTLVREDLELTIEPELGSLYMGGTLVARLDRDETAAGLTLLLNSRAERVRFDDVSVAGGEATLNATDASLDHALLAHVSFAEPKQHGDLVEVWFSCHSEGSGRQFVVSESIALASWVEAWYPILPQPDGVSLGAATQVAGTTVFHLPEDWHAVTNGARVSSEAGDGEVVELWETELALSRSFAAGPYAVTQASLNGMDVSLFLLSKDLPSPHRHVESLAVAIEAMEERWGPYPYPSYAIAEIPARQGDFGASSEQGFIMVKPGFLQSSEGNLPLFAHEASHGWWGNTVGSDGPGSLLCSESLAQYGAVIAAERLWGKRGATEFLRFSRPGYVADQCARGYFELMRRGQDKPLAQLVSGGGVDHTLSDAKGHWVYHMLRRRVGDETFFTTTRGLIEEFTGRTMTLDDVRARFVEAAPEAGLPRFFEQWLERTGAPVLAHDWHETGDGVSLTILQMQEGEPFELWLDVALETDDGTTRTERVMLGQEEQTFLLPGVAGVSEVRLDPEHELLLWSPELGPSPVPELEGLEPAPLSHDQLARYSGEFEVIGAGTQAKLSGEAGHLTLSLGSAPPQRLVHTGGDRFRSRDGFLVFLCSTERAESFLFVHDAGGARRALRRE